MHPSTKAHRHTTTRVGTYTFTPMQRTRLNFLLGEIAMQAKWIMRCGNSLQGYRDVYGIRLGTLVREADVAAYDKIADELMWPHFDAAEL
jgi:hypothetical protein